MASKAESAVLILSSIGIIGMCASSIKNNFLSSVLNSNSSSRNSFLNSGKNNPSPLLPSVSSESSVAKLLSKENKKKSQRNDSRTKIDDDVYSGVSSSWSYISLV